MFNGRNGLGDFTHACLDCKITPATINNLILMGRECPTTEFGKFEQNRVDGISLAGDIYALREAIHRQKPFVNELLKEIMAYHSGKSDGEGLNKILESNSILSHHQNKFMDKSLYNKKVLDGYNGNKTKVSIIELVKRLEENTREDLVSPPITPHNRLNMQTKKLYQFVSKNGNKYAPKMLNDILKISNKMLQERMGTVGIHPDYIKTFNWVGRRVYRTVKDMKFNEQIDMHKQPWFKELLKYQELTSSMSEKFDEKEFEEFYAEVKKSDYTTASKMVFDRTLKNVGDLKKHYDKSEKTKDRNNILYSGNIADSLIAWTTARNPDCQYALKLAKEKGLYVSKDDVKKETVKSKVKVNDSASMKFRYKVNQYR